MRIARRDDSRRRRVERLVAGAAVVTMTAAAVTAAAAPPDAVQGQWQRLMYLHVPAAWTAFLAFFIAGLAAVIQLGRADLRADRYSLAATEAATALTGLTLLAGSVWGHATWGTWWTWDPRLVSTLGLFLTALACLGVRGCSADPRWSARVAAVVAISGFAEVPVVYFSVRWWRTLHQQPTFLAPGGTAHIAPAMALALAAAALAFAVSLFWWLLHRVRHLELAALDEALSAAEEHRPVPALNR